MSFDKSTDGVSWNDSAAAPAVLSGLAAGDFTEGKGDIDSAILKYYVEPTADVSANTLPAPSATGICDGAELVLIKNNTGGGKITYTDPETGRTIDYVNKQDEAMTLTADLSSDTWVFKH